MDEIIRIERNQAKRDAYKLFDNIYYYFMPKGVMYLNVIKDDYSYSPLSLNNLRKRLNTPERIEAAKRMFGDWFDVIDDLDYRTFNYDKKMKLYNREYAETFKVN